MVSVCIQRKGISQILHWKLRDVETILWVSTQIWSKVVIRIFNWAPLKEKSIKRITSCNPRYHMQAPGSKDHKYQVMHTYRKDPITIIIVLTRNNSIKFHLWIIQLDWIFLRPWNCLILIKSHSSLKNI